VVTAYKDAYGTSHVGASAQGSPDPEGHPIRRVMSARNESEGDHHGSRDSDSCLCAAITSTTGDRSRWAIAASSITSVWDERIDTSACSSLRSQWC
jgi:hypothetical protein